MIKKEKHPLLHYTSQRHRWCMHANKFSIESIKTLTSDWYATFEDTEEVHNEEKNYPK